MELNKVYNMDCIEYMKTLPNECVDLIIADPPYFKIHGDFDFIWDNVEDYIKWCRECLLECERILKPTGSLYVWGVIGYGNGFPLMKLIDYLEKNTDLKVINWITQRNVRGRGTTKGYMRAREELVFMAKSKKYTWNNAYTNERSNRKDMGANGKPRTNEFKRCSDVWVDITEASQSSKQRFKLSNGTNFPTVKSLALCDRIINSSSNEGDLIYIPFAGSGSEIVSCINNNRNYIATELNKDYIEDIIKPRIDKIAR